MAKTLEVGKKYLVTGTPKNESYVLTELDFRASKEGEVLVNLTDLIGKDVEKNQALIIFTQEICDKLTDGCILYGTFNSEGPEPKTSVNVDTDVNKFGMKLDVEEIVESN